jgi:DNA recombination protein RmuC
MLRPGCRWLSVVSEDGKNMNVLFILAALSSGIVLGVLATGLLMYRRSVTEKRIWQKEALGMQTVFEERLNALNRESAFVQERLNQSELERKHVSEELTTEKSKNAALETRLNEERKHTAEKLTLVENAREQLALEFQNLAHRIFEDKSRRFTDQNRANLDQLLNPFRLQLKDFEKKVEETYQKEARERFSLKQEVLRLQDLNQRIQTDAVNLTNALKGQAKTQGIWGEIILERILEQSGLKKGREYEAQGSYRDAQGRQLRPDIIVHLPENKDIVIDSKVSLTAYERYVNITQDDQRKVALRQHLASLHGHVKSLQGKHYETLPEIRSLDFVLMFIPVEGAFMLALEEDESLFRKAFEQNVMIVSPSTLLLTLRTIQNIWRYEYQNRNAMEIARQAGNLYDHFVRFVEDLEKVGTLLDRTRQSYDQAHKRLATGRGNLVRRAEVLRQLGIQNSKVLSSSIRENAHIDLQEASPASCNEDA